MEKKKTKEEMWEKTGVKKLSRAGNLCNELFEFSDRLVQVRPDADWRSDGLALQIHNVNLHHHLCGQSETHPRRHKGLFEQTHPSESFTSTAFSLLQTILTKKYESREAGDR